jgi:hypothetical protein
MPSWVSSRHRRVRRVAGTGGPIGPHVQIVDRNVYQENHSPAKAA